MDVNVGVRLHSLVFSAVGNVPTIGISYDPKIDGFLELINMKPACTYNEVSVDKLMESVKKYMDGEKVDYRDKINEFKSVGEKTLDFIIKEIEG